MVFRAQDESPAPPRGLGKGEQPARGDLRVLRDEESVTYTIRPARVTRGRPPRAYKRKGATETVWIASQQNSSSETLSCGVRLHKDYQSR